MKIGLLKLENYPNIAIEKIRLYHHVLNDDVENYNNFNHYDIVYVSKIFSFTPDYPCLINADKIIYGGSGYNIHTKLPDKIEAIKPKINIGFTSRGCIRNCDFCIVKGKEGDFKIVGDIYDFWDGKTKKITLLDNNILANYDHFKQIMIQVMENKLDVDFNQGLDIRLLKDDKILLNFLVHYVKPYIRFSCDDFNLLPIIRKKIKLFGGKNSRIFFYILVGRNFEDLSNNLYTIQYLRNIGCSVFPQVYLPAGIKERKSIHHPIFDEVSRFGCVQFNRNLTFEMFLSMRNKLVLLKDYYKKLYRF